MTASYLCRFLVLFVLSLSCCTTVPAQTDLLKRYQPTWDSIATLQAEGKTASALAVAKKLYQSMDQNSTDPQAIAASIKTLLLVEQNQTRLEENGYTNSLLRLEAEANASTGVKQALLYSLIADLYQEYLQTNLWKIRGRSATDGFEPNDVLTWDVERLTLRIYDLYQKSLVEPSTRNIAPAAVMPLIEIGSNTETLRPTLYDVLLHRALDYFKSGQLHLTRPAYQFYLDDPKDFAPAAVFAQRPLETKDTLSPEYQALLLYQEGLKFHAGKVDPLMNLDLQRLRFVYSKSILPNKDELYEERLLALHKRYSTHTASAEVAFYLAQHYYQQGITYTPQSNVDARWKIVEARRWCTLTQEQHPNSYGAKHCLRLLNQLERPTLSLELEKINSINQKALYALRYRNVDLSHFRLIRLTEAMKEKMNSLYSDNRLAYLAGLPALKTWSEKLPNEQDYQEHRTELALHGLPRGEYLLLASIKSDFSYSSNSTAYSIFQVSNLRLVHNNDDAKGRYFVLDSRTGAPQANVLAEFYVQNYNSLLRKYVQKRIATSTTDENGFFEAPSAIVNNGNHRSFFIVLKSKDDELVFENGFYSYNDQQNSYREQTHFFLDRAIYRPGQVVYFKGLVLQYNKDQKVPQVVKNQKRTVIFFDANRQKIAEVELTTNEYGSFNGSFTAPSSGLLGQMFIEDTHNGSSIYFQVEEYKRPKFEVTALPVTEAYEVDDTVNVKGLAKAYAGNVIDGAKVQYSVTRQVNFPYWRWSWGWHHPTVQQQQIVTGETTTDENGEYTIAFAALPDRSVSPEQQPQFTYTVQATVTDITGETHSAQSTVRVGYVSLNVALHTPERTTAEDWKDLRFQTTNLNGQYEATKGTVIIEQLKTPEQIYVNRYWTKPDVYAIDSVTFKKDFPNFAYKNEDEPATWPTLKEVYNQTFTTTETNTELSLDGIKKWIPGTYKVTLNTADKSGNDIELVRFVVVYEKTDNEIPTNTALFVAQKDFRSLKPDTTIQVDLGSYAPDAYILYELEHDQKIVERRWLQPKGRTTLNIPIKEAYRGGAVYHLSTVLYNRFYHTTGFLNVPWDNKALVISYETFRDKLYPGEDETWTIKITGKEKDHVSAEVVASMYDASLDAFALNNWPSSFLPTYYGRLGLTGNYSFTSASTSQLGGRYPDIAVPDRNYPYLIWAGLKPTPYPYSYRLYNMPKGSASRNRSKVEKSAAPPSPPMKDEAAFGNAESGMVEDNVNQSIMADQDDALSERNEVANSPEKPESNPEETDFDDVKVRTNLKETVFFFPKLQTDEEGNLLIKFTMNEALTRWKFMLFAHSQEMDYGYSTRTVVTQKDLMVMPNPPRFLREGDDLQFTAKVSNLTEKTMTGKAQLQLFDAITMKSINAEFGLTNTDQSFEAKGGGSAPLAWKVQVPKNWVRPIVHRVVAKSGTFSDGEEAPLPVLTNRMLVTETKPLPIRGNQTKTFEFDRMKIASRSTTLQQHKLTLEFTQNPAWYAVQSLPYLMEYPYECTEQMFSRYYANSLASHVANSHPKIKRVFEQWRDYEPKALESNLMKNQELKYALIEETPWVLQAQSEGQQKKNIGLLFDLNRMANEEARAKKKLIERQLANGGFAWMPGGRDSWYITQYLVEGFGHLQVMGVSSAKDDPQLNNMLQKAVTYIDGELARAYRNLVRWSKKTDDPKAYMELDHLGSMEIHYFYARAFFKDQPIGNEAQTAFAYYEGQAKKYWNKKSRYLQGLLGLGLHRFGKDLETPQKIVTAARENALHSEERGMYWKYNQGYYWYQLPIETHSLMIELFDVVAQDAKAVDDLKVWLLKEKQTTHWKTTKATSAACYALLMTGDNWLMEDKDVTIQLGKTKIDVANMDKEAGTGYFKTTWEGKDIKPSMSTINVTNPNKNVAWGAVYWQYFEQLDKITHFKETPLKLDKQLFKEIPGDRGPVLKPIDQLDLEPGDKIVVRIELRVDRNMEYVHMKDHRASGLEPINVLSQYKYQDGLGYYESTRDVSTNFFFSYLPKGTYVFEYPLRVNLKGEFSNGVTTIQCMYAPEFTAHSEGIRIEVE